MSTTRPKVIKAAQQPVVIPDLTVKELLSVIPPHCFERSTLRAVSYVFMDYTIIISLCKLAYVLDEFLTPDYITLPHSYLYSMASFSIWALYSFIAGLFGFGLWGIGHECGHHTFSDNKWINDAFGYIIHTGLSVPYFSWRYSHAKHHAATSHMTREEVYVPRTRSELGLPPLNPAKEDVGGAYVSEDVMHELWDAIGDSPIGAMFYSFLYMTAGWPAYLFANAGGQAHYPTDTNHFDPSAVIFRPDQRNWIIASNVGIVVWLGLIMASISRWGFFEVFRCYLVPYLWVNHWMIIITFLQHTDPMLPHYRGPEFTFLRGALSTIDRNLLGDLGSFMGWFGAFATHGVSEVHVLHHVCSRIPHYHAWEATDAIRKRLAQDGIFLQGRPGGWAEMYRVFRECKFVEDEGDIVFYKNARGLAAAKAVYTEKAASDSGIEINGLEQDE
ncbi:fatty acid desaturase-domain-containing protein [Cubamyces menziesii]|nr:fatty acid desaturase-domain-containing protein [Cubamyces menziesii]